MRVWDLEKGTLLRTLTGHMKAVTSVAIALGGARIMFGRAQEAAPKGGAAPAKQAVEIYLEVADVKEYHDAVKAKE